MVRFSVETEMYYTSLSQIAEKNKNSEPIALIWRAKHGHLKTIMRISGFRSRKSRDVANSFPTHSILKKRPLQNMNHLRPVHTLVFKVKAATTNECNRLERRVAEAMKRQMAVSFVVAGTQAFKT